MPYAFVEISCNCFYSKKYNAFHLDNDGYLDDFICKHFKCVAFKRTRTGWLLGFDQLAGLYFDIKCLNCGKEQKCQYEAKTFGKEDKDYFINCCNNNLSFHCKWAHY